MCSTRPPQVGRPGPLIPSAAALWLLSLGLWLGGGISGSDAAQFAGMLLSLCVQIVWITGWLLSRQLATGGAKLEVLLGDAPCLLLEADGESRRVPLAPGSVRAWTVGNGFSGPLYLQLACGADPKTGLALFVVPALRHWKLAEGASWLNAYTGFSPVARGADLLDLIAPFVTPANGDWKPG